MLPRDQTPLLKRSVVGVASPPDESCVGGNAGDSRLEQGARASLYSTDGDAFANLKDQTRDVETEYRGVVGYEQACSTHDGVCRVEGHGLDSDEELSWAWLRGGSALNLKWLAFSDSDGGEVSSHDGLIVAKLGLAWEAEGV